MEISGDTFYAQQTEAPSSTSTPLGMLSSANHIPSLLSSLVTLSSPTLFLLPIALLLLILLYTRITSTLRFRHASQECFTTPTPHSPPPLPYTTPFLGHALSLGKGIPPLITTLSKQHRTFSTFQITLFGTQHNMILAPSLAHTILTSPKITSKLSMHELIFRTMETFWGDSKNEIRNSDQGRLWGDVHKVLHNLMRDEFVRPALEMLRTGVGANVINLVSGNESWVDQESWERTAGAEVVVGGEKGMVEVEASLHPLLRDFVGTHATNVLMGPDFLANYPEILADLWHHDSYFNALLSGVPDLLLPPSVRIARYRLVSAVADHHMALLKHLDGEDPGIMWGRVGEASSVIIGRAVEMRKSNMSEICMGRVDAAMLWAMNVNANQVIFWMVWYLYAHPDLLTEVRREVEKVVTVKQDEGGFGGVKAAPKLEMDLEGLKKNCPLLQGLFIETMRLEAGSLSYKFIDETFEASESSEDAKLFGRDTPQTYLFKKGEYLCVPHGVHQFDDRYFDKPEEFDVERFFEKQKPDVKSEKRSEPGKDEEDVKVTYKTMHVWGGGREVCKGKKFAEAEVLIFVASIALAWDIIPVDSNGKEIGWQFPGRVPSAGATKPKDDVRVKMRRRI